MNIEIKQVVPYSNAVLSLLNNHFNDVVTFDPNLADPYIEDVFMPKITAADNVVMTSSLRKQSKTDTQNRNKEMDKETPILTELDYRLNQCINDGTITESLSSFALGEFNRCITTRDVAGFHVAYETTYTKINITAIADALDAKGFDAAKILSIKTIHDNVITIQNEKGDLKVKISDLSEANQKVLNTVLQEDQKVLNAIKSMAKTKGNKELAKRATSKAVLSSVTPAPVKVPRNKHIPAGSSIILRSDIVAKNIIQLTLLTDVEVKISRQSLKSIIPTTGTHLPFNEMWTGKKDDIPGTGKYIKLTNYSTTKKAIVRYFEVNVIVD